MNVSDSGAEYLETFMDKFLFRVKRGYSYSADDLWIRVEGGQARIGMTDFLQRLSGDVAFVKFAALGERLRKGQSLADIETMKATVDIPAPLDGVLAESNEALDDRPELLNEDPYGEGWLVTMKPAGDPASLGLLDADAYFALMKQKLAEADAKRQAQGGGND